MNNQEAITKWQAMYPTLKARGLVADYVRMMVSPADYPEGTTLAELGLDANLGAPGPLGTDPNSAVPAMLTSSIDPEVLRWVFARLAMADIVGGERKVGNWLSEQRAFPVVEDTGEVSSYGDYANSGFASINFNYPWLQAYLFQTIIRYGERETERAGLMKISYVSDLNKAATNLMNRYANLTYAFGVAGLQTYGIINNPFLNAALSPSVKAWGGTTWFNNGVPAATAVEVYNDILTLIRRVVQQANGTVDSKSKMTLAIDPETSMALDFTNSFGVFVSDLLKKGFPNLTVKTAVQYGQQTTQNSQGFPTTGNVIQIIMDNVEGQEVAYAAFTEKMRAHKIIPELSAWAQKFTSGTWGVVLRQPFAVGTMLGV